VTKQREKVDQQINDFKKEFIYIPPLTTRINVDIIFPWMGKEYKVKQIPFKDVSSSFSWRQENDLKNK